MCTGAPIVSRVCVPPPSFSLLASLKIPLGTDSAALKTLVDKRASGDQTQIFDEAYSPRPPRTPSSSNIDLHPPVTVFKMDADYDLESGLLEAVCRRQPIVLIKGISKKVGFDTKLFTPDVLSDLAPDMKIGCRVQKRQSPDENMDGRGRTTWLLESVSKDKTIKEQATYMRKALEREEEEATGGAAKKAKKVERVEFGVNLLLDPSIFTQQIKEIERLPAIFRPGTEHDFLNYVEAVEGFNGVYSFLKVLGARTAAHEEDGAVPSINVACGPGASQWMAVAKEFVPLVEKEAKSKNLRLGTDVPVWPDSKELQQLGVPVYRFMQEPGDVVFTGAATLHWVQATGVCVHVAWNSGEVTAQLLHEAVDQYERNRIEKMESTIAMVRTFWKIAEEGTVTDQKTRKYIRAVLLRSLGYSMMVEKWVEEEGGSVEEIDPALADSSHSCDECKCEIVVFIFTAYSDSAARCYECMKSKGGMKAHFVVRQKKTVELASLYDNYQ